MLGLFDLFGRPSALKYFQDHVNDRSVYFDIDVSNPIEFTKDLQLWLAFSGFLKPELNVDRFFNIHHLFPKWGTLILINGPDAIAGYHPEDSVEAMRRLERCVRSLVGRYKNFKLNIFSISAGTYPGFYFANTLQANRLIAIAPGPRMGEGIYTSIFSRPIRDAAIAAGYPTAASYDEVINRYNQEANISCLPMGVNLQIYGGRCDHVIRNWGTREIANACHVSGKHPLFVNYSLFDHTSLGGWLAIKNAFGRNPYRLPEGDNSHFEPTDTLASQAAE